MKLTIEIDTASPDTVAAAAALLTQLAGDPATDPGPVKEPAKKTRTRKTTEKKAPAKSRKKKEPAKEPEDGLDELMGGGSSEDDDDGEPITMDELQGAIRDYVNRHSIDRGRELMESFGAKQLVDLPEEKWGDFLEALQK